MSSTEDLDLLYSPRKWSKRGSGEEVIEKHIEFVSKASDSARTNVPCQLNIAYGPTEREKYDIYGIDLPLDAPIFVYIHGGFWQQLNKDISSYPAETLHKHGIKVIVIGYNLCPNVTLPKITQEIQAAITKCCEYANNYSSKGIYICGHSAGAHLATSLFNQFFLSLSNTDQSNIKGVFCISGVFDLIPVVQTYVNDALNLDVAVAKELSPFHQPITATKNIFFFILVAQYDTPAFHDQSKAFNKKLKDCGYKSDLIILNAVDHFNIVENLSNDNDEIVKLILNTIKH